MSFRRLITRTLEIADVTINGDQPWDLRVNDKRFYRRAAKGAVGLGEAYVDGDWDVESLDAFFRQVIRSDLAGTAIARLNRAWLAARALLFNLQNPGRARAVAETHYDLDHRMYEQFLGPYNQYTCCFFDGTDRLEEAEVVKLRMICDKLELRAEDRVLDIGCGWGGFARYAATEIGCSVTGVTLSGEQAACARESTSGLPVDIVVCDYRELPDEFTGRFDKVLICGMIEHVGHKNYRRLMQVVSRVMKEDGLFLLHTIGNRDETRIVDPWIEKYIFRNSMIPSMRQLVGSISSLFVVQDWENYGHYYSQTLQAWQQNFERNWAAIRAIRTARPFDERFRRMWNYYLMSSKAAFDVESLLLWQIVMTRIGIRDSVYRRVNLRS